MGARASTQVDGGYLDYLIGSVLRQLFPDELNDDTTSTKTTKCTHSILELFHFPTLEAILTTEQQQTLDDDDAISTSIPEVICSFIAEFHNAVGVQTDFNAQVSFLPELLKTYLKSQDSIGTDRKPDDVVHHRDPRVFRCETWVVDPKIRFIDRFKWNPPVIDEILRKLQIFDHRTTIPKALQRGFLDQCDVLLAAVHRLSLNINRL